MNPAFLPSPSRDVFQVYPSSRWYLCSTRPQSTQNRNGVLKNKPDQQPETMQNTKEDLNGTAIKPAKTTTAPPRRRQTKQKNKRKSKPEVDLNSAVNADFCTVRPIWPALKRVLIVHCGGTFGMDVESSFDSSGQLRAGTGGTYRRALRPGKLLGDILEHVPELRRLADLDVIVAMNKDSARVGPKEWIQIAKLLHRKRNEFDAFCIVHGTDTMAYTGAALSLMLAGFRKPVVLTGSQLPMMRARSDARANLLDSVQCAVDGVLEEFAICFGGTLLRANRAQKTSSTAYRAFESPTHPALANLGVDIEWNHDALWEDPGVYRPRFKLQTNVLRIPVVPGLNPRVAYGNLFERGVRGAVLESFGVGNLNDTKSAGWIDWLKEQRKLGLEIYLASQCTTGPLHPELYKSGSKAMAYGAQATRRMTAETAVVKLMLTLAHGDLHPSFPLAGEL